MYSFTVCNKNEACCVNTVLVFCIHFANVEIIIRTARAHRFLTVSKIYDKNYLYFTETSVQIRKTLKYHDVVILGTNKYYLYDNNKRKK